VREVEIANYLLFVLSGVNSWIVGPKSDPPEPTPTKVSRSELRLDAAKASGVYENIDATYQNPLD